MVLAPRVQKYIDEEPSLILRVPELRMSDDGHPTDGEVDGKEVFTDTESKASAPPDVLAKDLLERENVHVIAHVRGTQGVPAALERIQKSLRGYGVWQDSWATRLNAVIGDLTQPHLGLDDDTWKIIRDSVDVVTHNGALVHWVKQYKHVERSNVLSTIDALRLCNQGKPKLFSFVSSTTRTTTSTCHKKKTSTGLGAVMEADDMTGSRTGLGTGYGPSKCGGRALPAFKAGAVEAQAKYGVGGRDGVNTSAPPS